MKTANQVPRMIDFQEKDRASLKVFLNKKLLRFEPNMSFLLDKTS